MQAPLFQNALSCAVNSLASTPNLYISPDIAGTIITALTTGATLSNVTTGVPVAVNLPATLTVGNTYRLNWNTSATNGDVAFVKVTTSTNTFYVTFTNVIPPISTINPVYSGVHPLFRTSQQGTSYSGDLALYNAVTNVKIVDVPPTSNAIPSEDTFAAADPVNKRLFRYGSVEYSSAPTTNVPVAVANIPNVFSGGVGDTYDSWVMLQNGNVDIFNNIGNWYSTLQLGGQPVQAAFIQTTNVVYVANFAGYVTKVTISGTTITYKRITVNLPTGVTVTSNNVVLVSSYDGNVYRINSDDTVTALAVEVGQPLTAICAIGSVAYTCCPTTSKIYKINAVFAIEYNKVVPDFPLFLSVNLNNSSLIITPAYGKSYFVWNGTTFSTITLQNYIYYVAEIASGMTVVSYYASDALPYITPQPSQLANVGGVVKSSITPSGTVNTTQITVSGLYSPVLVEIPSDVNGVMYKNGASSGAKTISVFNGDTFYASLVTSSSPYTRYYIPIASNGVVEYADLTTGMPQDRPNAFLFGTDLIAAGNQATSTIAVTISGLGSGVSVTATSNAVIIKNGSAVGSTTTLTNGDVIRLQYTPTANTAVSIVVGSYVTSWDILVTGETNRVNLGSLTNLPQAAPQLSATYTFAAPLLVSWVAVPGCSVLRNGVAVTSPTTFNAGDVFQFSASSSIQYYEIFRFTAVASQLELLYTLQTEPDTIPDGLNLGYSLNVKPSDIITSQTGTISGVTPGVSANVYVKNTLISLIINGNNVGQAGSVKNGDTIAITFPGKTGAKTVWMNVYANEADGFEQAFIQYQVVPIQLNGGILVHRNTETSQLAFGNVYHQWSNKIQNAITGQNGWSPLGRKIDNPLLGTLYHDGGAEEFPGLSPLLNNNHTQIRMPVAVLIPDSNHTRPKFDIPVTAQLEQGHTRAKFNVTPTQGQQSSNHFAMMIATVYQYSGWHVQTDILHTAIIRGEFDRHTVNMFYQWESLADRDVETTYVKETLSDRETDVFYWKSPVLGVAFFMDQALKYEQPLDKYFPTEVVKETPSRHSFDTTFMLRDDPTVPLFDTNFTRDTVIGTSRLPLADYTRHLLLGTSTMNNLPQPVNDRSLGVSYILPLPIRDVSFGVGKIVSLHTFDVQPTRKTTAGFKAVPYQRVDYPPVNDLTQYGAFDTEADAEAYIVANQLDAVVIPIGNKFTYLLNTNSNLYCATGNITQKFPAAWYIQGG